MFKILGGELYKNRLGYIFGSIIFVPPKHSWWRLSIVRPNQITRLEIATEDSIKSMTGTLGWGAAGGLILGPIGLLAGLLLGGKKKEIAFICQLSDGRKFMAITEPRYFQQLQALTLHLH